MRPAALLAALLLAACGDSPPASRPGSAPAAEEARPVSFEDLAGWTWKPGGALPERVRALHGRRVLVAGLAAPAGKEARRFLLVRNADVCCSDRRPALNEWILVTLGPGLDGALPSNHQPVAVRGRLEVGEERRGGEVESLYRLTAEALPGRD